MQMKAKLGHVFRSTLTLISPELNTRVTYRVKFGKKLDLNHPVTFNEKCSWLKLNTYRNNELVRDCADKYAVREYIVKKGYPDILNGLIGRYTDPEDIRWDELPQRFAIKMNGGCGHNIIVFDKSTLDVDATKKKLKKWMKKKHAYLGYSEMQYKGVEPCILIEEFIGDRDELPLDYKFFCLNGVCRGVLACKNRVIGQHAEYYFMDKDWKVLPYTSDAVKNPDVDIPRPAGLDEAMAIAEDLSRDFPQVRVDFFLVNGRIYFGELTFTTAGAMWTEFAAQQVPGTGKSVDELLGEMLVLPTDNN